MSSDLTKHARQALDAADLNGTVSRETCDAIAADLARFAATLLRWQAKINLIGRSTADELWSRHIVDSLQLIPLAPASARSWIDLGTGAGLPGMIVAVWAKHVRPDLQVHLVEISGKKIAFLIEAMRVVGVTAKLHRARLEDMAPMPVDIVSARALAPMPLLLDYAQRFFGPETIGLFPKGRDVEAELEAAKGVWEFNTEQYPSRTDPDGRILVLSGLRSSR